LGGLRRGDEPEVMFGVLEVIFRRDGIAAGMGVARQLQIFFCDMMRVAADFHVRPIRFVGPRERIGATAIVIGATPHALVLTRSHLLSLTFEISELRVFFVFRGSLRTTSACPAVLGRGPESC
jgi:hypothetical protein